MGDDRLGRMRAVAREALLDAWAVLQPVECAGCGAPDRGVCARCRAALVPRVRRREIDSLELPVIAAADYDGVPRALLLSGKEEGREDALRALAPMLARAVVEAVAVPVDGIGKGSHDPVELTWVPSTRAAARRRGYDPVLLMLRAARLPASRVLAASGSVEQKRLRRADRVASAAGRMRAITRLAGRRFVLVDDVVTTGATIRAAVEAIRLGGGDVRAVCCLGTVALRYPTRDTGPGEH